MSDRMRIARAYEVSLFAGRMDEVAAAFTRSKCPSCRMRPLGPGCRRPWGHGGSGGRAACHRHISRRRRSRCQGVLCRLRSG